MEMVLAGSINKDIVSRLNSLGGKAIGICGKDGNLIQVKKKVSMDNVDLGYVGEIKKVDSKIIEVLASDEYIPVIAPIGTDDKEMCIRDREYVYLIEGNKCNVLDIRNGNIVKVFETGEEETRQLGYIGVYEDLLVLGNNFADFEEMMESDSMRIKSPKFTDYNLSASKGLIVMNRCLLYTSRCV